MLEPDPILSKLEWLCHKMMHVEVTNKIGTSKNERSLLKQDNKKTQLLLGFNHLFGGPEPLLILSESVTRKVIYKM